MSAENIMDAILKGKDEEFHYEHLEILAKNVPTNEEVSYIIYFIDVIIICVIVTTKLILICCCETVLD